MLLRISDNEGRRIANWGGRRARRSYYGWTMREDAQGAMSMAYTAGSQVFVQMDGLHKAKTDDHEHRECGN